MKKKFFALLIFIPILLPFFAPAGLAQNVQNNIIMSALKKELDRSFLKLEKAREAPLYFLAYRFYDIQTLNVVAEDGALTFEPNLQHKRILNVEVRVGTPKMDNTHSVRRLGQIFCLRSFAPTLIPIEDNEDAIRSVIWLKTDSAFQDAQERYVHVKADAEMHRKAQMMHLSKLNTHIDKQNTKGPAQNKESIPHEETIADDFSPAKPSVYVGNPDSLVADRDQWSSRLRGLSAIYCHYPHILHSRIEFTATKTCRYLVNSEGTAIEDTTVNYRIYTMAQAKSEDGMNVWLSDGAEAASPQELPSEEALSAMINNLAENVEKLRLAPAAGPYTGPVIFKAKAAAVYAHDTIGNRMEYCPARPNYLTTKIGQQITIMPNLISVVDDPTIEKINSQPVIGSYHIDDDGIPAQKVTLVDHGVFKTMLVGRTPAIGTVTSNGHGRCAPGYSPAARQSNLIIMSANSIPYTNSVPYQELRTELIAESKSKASNTDWLLMKWPVV